MTPHETPHQARVREILADLATIDYALPGRHRPAYDQLRDRPGCHCQADPPVLHGPYLSWIRKSDGKAITRKLTPETGEQRYRRWFDNSRRLRELITELQALSVQIAENAEGWQHLRP